MGLTPFILFLKTKTCSIKTCTFSNSRSCCTPGKHGQGFELSCPKQISLLLRVPLSKGLYAFHICQSKEKPCLV